MGAASHPADRSRSSPPGTPAHGRGAVPPDRDAAAGRLRPLPAREPRRPPGRARTLVRDATFCRRRTLAAHAGRRSRVGDPGRDRAGGSHARGRRDHRRGGAVPERRADRRRDRVAPSRPGHCGRAGPWHLDARGGESGCTRGREGSSRGRPRGRRATTSLRRRPARTLDAQRRPRRASGARRRARARAAGHARAPAARDRRPRARGRGGGRSPTR